MERESQLQLNDQRERWNSRAGSWDNELTKPDHYANFENGYRRFLDFAHEELLGVSADVGLDIGCGTGITSVLLAEKVKTLYLVDIAEKMLEEAVKKIPDAIPLNSLATEINLPDASVDIAISRGILVSHLPRELVPDFFGELKRLVKPQGMIIFDFMCNPGTADFKLSSPKNTFTLEKMTKELTNIDFGQIKFEGNNENRVVRVSAIKTE